jgi:DNA replication protein DnaC
MSSAPPPSPAASAILTSYLTQLRLPTMAASCAAVAREAAASNLDYLAFLTLLCGQEVAQREQTQAARRIAQAQFPWPKTLDEFDVSAAPTVQPAAVLQLVSGACVRAPEHWRVLGGPGVGTTH